MQIAFLEQLGDAADIVLALVGVLAVGFALARWFQSRGHDVEVLKLNREIDQQKALTDGARSELQAAREAARTWESRYKEIAPGLDSANMALRHKVEAIRQVSEQRGLHWLRPSETPYAPAQPAVGGTRIIAIANLKGGVGKTTIAVHLAAYLGLKGPTLLIDLDHQGSASTQMLKAGLGIDSQHSFSSRAEQLLSVESEAIVSLLPQGLGQKLANVSIIPAFYSLSDFEDRLMLRWIVGDEGDDIRFRLNRYLRSTEFQSRFRYIVIDCPPRLTTAMVNALCASTHLLVPTQLTMTSAEAATYFLNQLRRFREAGLCGSLRVCGVIPSMLERANENAFEGGARSYLERTLQEHSAPFLADVGIRRNVAFARAAGADLVHLADQRTTAANKAAWDQIRALGDRLLEGFALETERTG